MGKVIAWILDAIDSFIERHIVAVFEGPAECYDCNEVTCAGCPIMEDDQCQ